MTKPQLIKLVEEIEDLVSKKMPIWDYDKNMPKVVQELHNRYVQPELGLEENN